MQIEFIKAIKDGKLVKTNTFVTELGEYKIDIFAYEKHVYFIKYKNGKLVECANLTSRGENK